MVHHLLEPVIPAGGMKIVCEVGELDGLLAKLAVHSHSLDIVFTDKPIPTKFPSKAFNHVLGTSEVDIYAQRRIARAHVKSFPYCLEGAPFLMPPEHDTRRRELDGRMTAKGIKPKILREFSNAALMKYFGSTGIGLFAAPMLLKDDVEKRYNSMLIGRS